MQRRAGVKMPQPATAGLAGTELAQKGVDHGLSQARQLGAQVTIFVVSPIGFQYGGRPLRPIRNSMDS
jgi:hypothetical protein